MKRRLLCLFVGPLGLALLAALPACQSKSTAPHTGQPDPVAAPANNPNIELMSGDLQRSLGFDSPIVADDDGLLTVTVPVRNLSDNRYQLDYKFIWYGAQGREAKPLMGWKEISLGPREQRQMTANALDTGAKRWKLQVQWANR